MHTSKLAAQALRGQSSRNGVSVPLLANRPRTISLLISKSASPQATATASMAEVNLDYKALLPDYNFLRSLVKTISLVLDRPVSSTEKQYFQLPLRMLFTAPSRELGLQMKETFALALKEKGLVIIELGFEDPESLFMFELVEIMGYVPDTHSSTQGALLSGVMSAKTGTTAHSHSDGDGEFAWHTDGCFEARPQCFFGLHVVHPDTLGGGIFRALPAEDLIGALSPQSVEALLRTELDIQGQATMKGHVMPPSTDPASNAAVAELNALLDSPETKGWRFSDDIFKKNVVILMDNARFLHMRTEIRNRRRVRFHGHSAAN
ncbi:hypothetical protein DFH08DRAFT_953563 [Mycena albidolilacea]|uniref:TauD/TfdA-like domain-containing protein n=1 Tax=Mycena albidolilacea TaxID=1033008 RepID=A0AAD7AH00_9AGAR|nr:hypothetical protein DFH08DRAFT_953563 [Mycena albidolilacea]